MGDGQAPIVPRCPFPEHWTGGDAFAIGNSPALAHSRSVCTRNLLRPSTESLGKLAAHPIALFVLSPSEFHSPRFVSWLLVVSCFAIKARGSYRPRIHSSSRTRHGHHPRHVILIVNFHKSPITWFFFWHDPRECFRRSPVPQELAKWRREAHAQARPPFILFDSSLPTFFSYSHLGITPPQHSGFIPFSFYSPLPLPNPPPNLLSEPVPLKISFRNKEGFQMFYTRKPGDGKNDVFFLFWQNE